ncbi:Arc family DNA-binding protein [Mangrovicoccus sp. HB161399]|nr:Arc family DNA-binding protein [Mangrovicoccus sp. HB161399]
MKADTKHFKLNLPTDLLDQLREIAGHECRSVTAQIVLMLRKQIEADQT